MTQLKLMASAAGLAFLLIGATSTRAAAPSPYIATSTVDIGWTQTNTGVCGYTLPVGCSFTNSDLGADGSFGKGTVTISGGTDPSVIVTAKASGSGQDVASVAELIYYIQLVRKPGNIAAVLQNGVGIAGNIRWAPYSDNNGNGTYGQGGVAVFDPSNAQVYSDSSNGTFYDNIGNMTIGAQYKVILNVEADASAYQGGSTSATSYIDPSFSLTGVDASNFEFEYSPGLLQGVATVPEPSTWALILVGLGGLGASMRARRRHPAVSGV